MNVLDVVINDESYDNLEVLLIVLVVFGIVAVGLWIINNFPRR